MPLLRESQIPIETRIAQAKAEAASRKKRSHTVARRFADTARSGDLPGFSACVQEALSLNAIGRALKAIASVDKVHEEIQRVFVQSWITFGDSLRGEAQADISVLDGLWKLLPSYTGPAITLYRGCTWLDRCRRTYGMSWTSSREVAESFAQGKRRDTDDGATLLMTEAPANAIIFAPAHDHNDYGEFEYVADRRRLGKVVLLDRYPPLPFGA